MVKPTPVHIPVSLRTCKKLPTPPDPDNPKTTQKDVAIYIVDVNETASDCRRKLRTVVGIVDAHNARAPK